MSEKPVESLCGARDADFEAWRAAMLKWQRDCEQQISLRDQFAAAALTGLLAQGDDGSFSEESYVRGAYRWADAMLRERGNHPEKPNSSTKERMTKVSFGEPVAWAVVSDSKEEIDCEFVYPDEATAGDVSLDCNGGVVPLYRHPQPTLTDAERRAITALLDRLHVNDAIDVELTATPRGLLERLGAANYGDDRRSVGGE